MVHVDGGSFFFCCGSIREENETMVTKKIKKGGVKTAYLMA